MRLNKYLAACGTSSRRGADEIISAGKVAINGRRVFELGACVDPEKDAVTVDGKPVSLCEENVYIMLNKPAGVLSSCGDERGRKTVTDIVKVAGARLFPVGRLDMDTEGLLLLTNDGDFAYRLTHPKHDIEKKYLAVVSGSPGELSLDKLRRGAVIDGYNTKAAKIEKLLSASGKTEFYVTIHEGRNRQIKKMFESIGCSVVYLKRISVAGLELGDLKQGQWRRLESKDLEYLNEK